MKLFTLIAVGASLFGATTLSGQSNDGASFNFEYNKGKGEWAPYERVISEHYKNYPFMTDTGNIARKKMGVGFSCSVVEDRKLFGFRIGGMRSTAWADGTSPQGGQWQEIILVKTNCTEVYAGYLFVRSDWFRMGITGGFGFNVVKMKSERSDEAFPNAKAGKYILLNPGNATNMENTMFCSVKLGLPIAIGRKIAISAEPFLSIPLWKVNTMEIRDEMNPNSSPDGDAAHYKGIIGYAGIHFAFCIGGIQL